jgi:hypothetical protein
MTRQTHSGEERREEEVRPGLTMRVRRTRKEDGRYLTYYEFERAERPEPGAGREECDE